MEVGNKIPALATLSFMRTVAANVDNPDLKDDQFRLMVMNCLVAVKRSYPDAPNDNRKVNTSTPT